MPRGNPTKQTVASAKYQKKAGYKTVAFKMRGDLPERFAKACEAAGRPKSVVIAELMQEFIKQNEK